MLLWGFLCCCALFLLAEGQMPRHRRRAQRLPEPRRFQNAANIPGRETTVASASAPNSDAQTWRELLYQQQVHNEMDFINLLVTNNGTRVTENNVFSPYQTADGKRVIREGGIMATSDECSPRNMSVRLPLDYSDNQVAYYPECTMVQRCGGCTPTPLLSCQPQYKEKIVLKVLRARFLYPGALSMQWEGFSSVEVERHLTCRAICTLQPGDCGPNQRFNYYQCKCLCVHSQQCSNGKVWDPEACTCRCLNSGPCCAESGEEDDRTCTSYFDPDFCECTLKSSIGFATNATRAEIDRWLANRQATTTPAPVSNNSCARRICPRNFIRVPLPNNRCVCRFRARSRSSRYRQRATALERLLSSNV